jgi:hypothetical protein
VSTRIFKISILEQISKAVFEAVDLAGISTKPLIPGKETIFDFDGKEFGMKIEPYTQSTKNYLPIPTNHSDLQGYYNFGFDLGGFTQRQKKQQYKDLAKPLAIILKSFISWIKDTQPQYVTVYPDGKDLEEKTKKLNLYTALLNREESTIKALGYTWDFAKSKKLGKIIVIYKK